MIKTTLKNTLKKYLIVEFDKDYRTITDRFYKKFSSEEEADEWCRRESWSGYFYYVRKVD